MPTDYKIPLGQVIAEFIDWLTLSGADYFDAFADGLEFLIYSVTDALTWHQSLGAHRVVWSVDPADST